MPDIVGKARYPFDADCGVFAVFADMCRQCDDTVALRKWEVQELAIRIVRAPACVRAIRALDSMQHISLAVVQNIMNLAPGEYMEWRRCDRGRIHAIWFKVDGEATRKS
ncbi:hypothetical protein GCM10027419_06170 [Pandoraea terrae]